jgi:hypothetical protein
VLWRKDDKHIQHDWLEPGWLPSEPELQYAQLQLEQTIDKALQNIGVLPFFAIVTEALTDENALVSVLQYLFIPYCKMRKCSWLFSHFKHIFKTKKYIYIVHVVKIVIYY